MGRLVCSRATSYFLPTHPSRPQRQVAAAFARADLFVFPTFAEGSSRSGMEAAAAGLPIITTRKLRLAAGAWKERDLSYRSTILTSLAEAIARLSSDEDLRESIGRNAMRTVTENYTWAHYGQRVAEYLKEAVDEVHA